MSEASYTYEQAIADAPEHVVLRSELPELNWAKGEQRLPEWMIERHGYEKARRIGMMAMVGGKDKTRIRNATPPEFRQLLIDIASKCGRFYP